MTTSLGAKLKHHRQEKGYSLDKLAELTESSKSYLWELENRESQRPSAEKLTALGDALGVSASYFLEEDTRAPEERHLDEAFFRGYQKLDADAKEQLRRQLYDQQVEKSIQSWLKDLRRKAHVDLRL